MRDARPVPPAVHYVSVEPPRGEARGTGTLSHSDAQRGCLLFAYGTLLDPDVQRNTIGRRIPGTPDELEGYRIASVRDGIETFPNLTPDLGGRVPGRVLDLTQDELARADRYEGDLYRREWLTLSSGINAWVYIAP